MFWWSNVRGENLRLSLTDVIVGFFDGNDLLNYLIILGKLSIWECRRNKSPPKFHLFLHKAEAKKETEKLIALRNKKLPIKKKSFNFGVHALSLQVQIKYFAIKKQKLICSLCLE